MMERGGGLRTNKRKGLTHMDSSTHNPAAEKEENRQAILRAWDSITERHATLLAELAKQLASVPAKDQKGGRA